MRGPQVRSVALVGCGRLGAALGALAEGAGLAVRALDVRPEAVPARWRAGSAGAAVAGADAVVLAVPVPALEGALQALRPLLTPAHLVLDVASVKVRPVAWMARALGAAVPWAGTHPLFGPGSLARGERPLRAVVCPNALHPEAAARAEALYARLGCEVLALSPDAHDAALARAHALPLFLGQALAALGVDAASPLAPPSHGALVRLAEGARAEAAHLLAAVQQENPYAAEERARLLGALTALHASLGEAPAPSGGAAAGAPLTPVEPALAAARARIDALDRELLSVLQRRAAAAREARAAKGVQGLPVHDAAREAALLAERRGWAGEAGLDAEGAEGVFRAVLQLSRRGLLGD
jgi:prephenate dehydrogenase